MQIKDFKPEELIKDLEVEPKLAAHIKVIFDDSGLPIGTLRYTYHNTIRPFVYLENMQVNESVRREGIMTALMSDLQDEIRSKKRVAFLCDISGIDGLYEKFGWYNFAHNCYSYGYGIHPSDNEILEMRRIIIERDNNVGNNFYLIKNDPHKI